MPVFTLLRYLRRLRRHKGIGLGIVALLLGLSVLGNAICFYVFDHHLQDDLQFGDALWYSVISVTTIGYGDYSASSLGARLGTVLFTVLLGLGAFSVFIGMTIDWVTDYALREKRGLAKVMSKNHILIVNFPSVSRVLQLIEELKSDPLHADREIVIVTDQIEELPIHDHRVLFVRGPVLEQETYDQASAAKAKLAIVLATSYADPNSDAVVASIAAVLHRINSEMHVVAECLNEKHRILFSSVNCDALVFSLKISGNLLAQEVHDPGVAQLVDMITSNLRGTTLYSTLVESSDGLDYHVLARRLLDRDVNLMCINRGPETLTSFLNLQPQAGDRAIFAAARRLDWRELMELAGSSDPA